MNRAAIEDPVTALLHKIGDADPLLLGVVQEARQLIQDVAQGAEESVKYGGVLFAAPAPFCGLFAYKGHVSLEFGRGCDLTDTHGSLEGAGKFRRHIKLTSVADLESKRVRDYVAQALTNARKTT